VDRSVGLPAEEAHQHFRALWGGPVRLVQLDAGGRREGGDDQERQGPAAPAPGDGHEERGELEAEQRKGVDVGPATAERVVLWIDKQTYLTLRSERDTPQGTERHEVTGIRYDVDVPSGLFQYAPHPAPRSCSRSDAAGRVRSR
jgi:hypothetical protein